MPSRLAAAVHYTPDGNRNGSGQGNQHGPSPDSANTSTSKTISLDDRDSDTDIVSSFDFDFDSDNDDDGSDDDDYILTSVTPTSNMGGIGAWTPPLLDWFCVGCLSELDVAGMGTERGEHTPPLVSVQELIELVDENRARLYAKRFCALREGEP